MILLPTRHFCVFWLPGRDFGAFFLLPRVHFSVCFGFQEVSFSYFNQPKGHISVVYQPERHFDICFGSQEGNLVHILLKRGPF